MKPTINEVIEKWFDCPTCKAENKFRIDHLLHRNATFGPWHCDKCLTQIKGTVTNGNVEIELLPEKYAAGVHLLRIIGTDNFVTVDGLYTGNSQYYYEEHTCPTNIARAIKEFFGPFLEGQYIEDPHGLFQWVMSVPQHETVNWEDIIAKHMAKSREVQH